MTQEFAMMKKGYKHKVFKRKNNLGMKDERVMRFDEG